MQRALGHAVEIALNDDLAVMQNNETVSVARVEPLGDGAGLASNG
jgi:hypothetical protein